MAAFFHCCAARRCARAASGHAAAAPPNAASKSRRPMVTVIRPSRARRVKETIPYHESVVAAHCAAVTGRYSTRWNASAAKMASAMFMAGPATLVTYYVLFFIHLESRRVDIAGITVHPDE